jgi:hypothetical protein
MRYFNGQVALWQNLGCATLKWYFIGFAVDGYLRQENWSYIKKTSSEVVAGAIHLTSCALLEIAQFFTHLSVFDLIHITILETLKPLTWPRSYQKLPVMRSPFWFDVESMWVLRMIRWFQGHKPSRVTAGKMINLIVLNHSSAYLD